MAVGDQKLKTLYLMKILFEETDEQHGITMEEIVNKLKELGIKTDRKVVYADLNVLRRFGMAIEGEQKNNNYYYRVVEREFELAELKLLVDSLQSAKFISQKKSNELIKKLEKLTSKTQAAQLERQVYVAGRVKSDNEKIFYNVDAIHNAIAKKVKIKFKYFNYNEKKQKVYHDKGAFKIVSPWAVTLAEENYYMIAYDSDAEQLKTYRIDKMEKSEVTDKPREGEKVFRNLNIAEYSNQRIRMYGGEVKKVILECHNDFAAVIIDRFGKNIVLKKSDEEHFTCKVDVAVSNQFISWVLSMNQGIKIIAPEEVVCDVKKKIKEFQKTYRQA